MTTDQGAREARYAEAINVGRVNANLMGENPLGELLDLVDAEVAAAVSEAQAEVSKWVQRYGHQMGVTDEWVSRAFAAEAEVGRLREGIRALADDRDSHSAGCPTWFISPGECDCLVAHLRALLDRSPAATTCEADEAHRLNAIIDGIARGDADLAKEDAARQDEERHQ